MKKQTKKTAATPAKSKGEAKPTANAEAVAPVRVCDIGKNCPPMVEGAMRAVRGLFQDAVDATRSLRPVAEAEAVAPFSFPEWKADAQGIIPAPPIPPPPPVGAKVDPWRDWARRIVSRCGWSWDALEENERQPCSREIVGWGGAVYWALAHAVKLTPARLDEAAAELAGVLVAAAEKKDCDRFCTACNLFPETVRRLAEAPADATPPASTSNPATDADKPANGKKHNGPKGPHKKIGVDLAAALLRVPKRTLERIEANARTHGASPKQLYGWTEHYRENWEAFNGFKELVGKQEGLDKDFRQRLAEFGPILQRILRANAAGDETGVLHAVNELEDFVGMTITRRP